MRELRAALRALSERGTPIGSELLRQRVAAELSGERGRASARRWEAPAWLVAAAFAVTILVVGIPLYLLMRGSEETITSTGVVTTTIPPTTVAPTTSTVAAADLAMRWQRVESEALTGAGRLTGLIATDSGFVAAGEAAVWFSADGSTWQRSAAGIFGSTGILNDVAAGPDGRLVVVGSSDGFPAVWVSPDGATWSMVELDAAVFPLEGELTVVVAWDGGWLAGGKTWAYTQGGPAGPFLGIWLSPDGVAWERVADPTDPGWEQATVTELLVWGGTAYALGYTEQPDPLLDTPAVWASADGRTWHPIDAEHGGEVGKPEGYPDRGAFIEGATGAGDALYAVGMQLSRLEPPGTWGPAVWRSEDGDTWSLLPTDFRAPGRSTHGSDLKPVAADGSRLVAIELCTFVSSSSPSNYVWASPDGGDTWQPVAELGLAHGCAGGAAWALAFDGTRFVAVGDDGADAAIWVGEWSEG